MTSPTPSPISQAAGEPIPMLLFCPKCHSQHIDSPKWERDVHDMEQGLICTWANPPHKSHLCHACGNIWRPADVTTTGVVCIQTRGKADTWDSTAPTTGSAPDMFDQGSPATQAVNTRILNLARPAASMLTDVDALIGEAKSALDETYGFAATSRRSQENINFVCEKLDELRALLAASMGGDKS